MIIVAIWNLFELVIFAAAIVLMVIAFVTHKDILFVTGDVLFVAISIIGGVRGINEDAREQEQV